MYSIILAVALLFGLAQAQTTSSLTTSASRASSYLTVLGGNDYMTSGVAASIVSLSSNAFHVHAGTNRLLRSVLMSAIQPMLFNVQLGMAADQVKTLLHQVRCSSA